MRSGLRCFNGVFLSSLGMFSLNYGETRALFLRKATFQARFPFLHVGLLLRFFAFMERIHSFVRSRISLKYDYIVAT